MYLSITSIRHTKAHVSWEVEAVVHLNVGQTVVHISGECSRHALVVISKVVQTLAIIIDDGKSSRAQSRVGRLEVIEKLGKCESMCFDTAQDCTWLRANMH